MDIIYRSFLNCYYFDLEELHCVPELVTSHFISHKSTLPLHFFLTETSLPSTLVCGKNQSDQLIHPSIVDQTSQMATIRTPTKKTKALRGRPVLAPTRTNPPRGVPETGTSMPDPESVITETIVSRPSSPRETMPSQTLENTGAQAPIRPPTPREHEPLDNLDDTRASTDVEDSGDESEGEQIDPRWSTVRRNRAQSLDSTEAGLRKRNYFHLKLDDLPTEKREAVVDEAKKPSSVKEKESRRRKRKRISPESEQPRIKGKGTDPREWGASGINPEEIDIDEQIAMLNAYKRSREKAKKRAGKPKNKRDASSEDSGSEENFQMPLVAMRENTTPKVDARELEAKRAGSRPAAQIVPESSLGITLGNVARLTGDPSDPDNSSGSSSEYEGSSSSRSSYNSSRSRRGRHRRRRGSRRGSNKRSKKRSRRRSRHRSKGHSTAIKPIAPKDYDGTADARAYHRFVMEGQAYLRDGRVHRERQIRILAHYLDGKAHNFYMQKVASDDPKNWTLHKFFTELFNYCFSVDYRQQMRIKLENFHQKQGQSVSEFVFELQELFSMVGTMPQEMKVIKLWYSLSPRIQKALWRDNLHPDSSTWDEVVSKAEIIEIADSVVSRREPGPQTRRD